MTPGAYRLMDGNAAAIDFEDALWRLEDLLEQPVRVLANFRGTFGSCALQGVLTRIETLPPDDCAVNVLLDDRQGITIDPIDSEAQLAQRRGTLGKSRIPHFRSQNQHARYTGGLVSVPGVLVAASASVVYIVRARRAI